MGDAWIGKVLAAKFEQLPFIVKVDGFAGMSKERRVLVVAPGLEQPDSVILLRRAVRTVFFVGPVDGVDLPPENSAFEGAASLLDFIRCQFPRNRGTVLPFERRGQLGVRKEHRFELLSCQT